MVLLRLGDLATACMGCVAYYALKVTASIDRALENEETTVVLGIEAANGISVAWYKIKNEVYHDCALVGFLVNPPPLEERLNMEGLTAIVIHEASERAMCRLYFDRDDIDSLICEFLASLTEFEQRHASFSH